MKKTLLLILLLIVLGLGGVGYLLTTERGLRFMVGFADGLSGGAVTIKSVHGNVLSGWVFENVSLNIPSMKVEIFELQMAWQAGRLQKKEIWADKLSIEGLSVHLKDTGGNGYGSGESSISKPEKLLLPVTLVVDLVELNNVNVWNADGSELAAIEHLQFGAGYREGRLEVKDFSLTSAGNKLELAGVLDTTQDWQLGFAGSLISVIPEKLHLAGSFTVEGALEAPVLKVDLVNPYPARIEAMLSHVFTSPQWSIHANVKKWQLGTFISPGMDVVLTSNIDVSGDLKEWSGSVSGAVSNPDISHAEISLVVEGTNDSVHLVRGTIFTPYGNVNSAEGNFDWKDGIGWKGRVDIMDLDPGLFGQEYSARISTTLDSTGALSPGKSLTADIHVDDLRGVYHDHPFNGGGEFRFSDNQLFVTLLEIQNGSAHISLNGTVGYNLAKSGKKHLLDWDVGLQLTEFDPSFFLEDYPGKIDLRAASSGEVEGGSVLAEFDLQELSGTVRGFPLSGHGLGQVRDGSLDLEDLHFSSGRSEVHVSGRVDEELGMSVTIISPDIGEVLAGAGGELSLNGKILGSRELPLVDMELSGSGLYVDDVRIGTLRGEMAGSPDFGSNFQFSLIGQDISYENAVIDDVGIQVSGTAREHDLQLTMKSDSINIVTKGSGTLDKEMVWNGTLEKSTIDNKNGGLWRLTQEARLAVSSSAISVDDFCYSGIGEDEKICLLGAWQVESEQWQGTLKWDGIDLSRIDTRSVLSEQVYGSTEGAISAEGNLSEVSLGRLHLGLFNTSIGRPGYNGDWELADIDSLMVDATLYNGKLQGGLTVFMADGNSGDATVAVTDFGRFDQDIRFAEISGEINLSANNLDFVAPLTAYYVYPSGALKGKLDLFGTIWYPQAAGTLVLTDGGIDFPTFGVQLEDVVFDVVGERNVLTINAQGTSGPGRLFADGSLTIGLDDLLGEFNFEGENIDTFRLPEYEIRANPDLRLVFDTDGGVLLGKLFIPHALLTPEKMINSLSESDDVIFLDDENEMADTNWFFKTLLDVELGDDVRLDGYGIKGNLHGELQAEKLSGSFVTGTGVLSMQDGQFSVYGRTLDIERGRVFFGGGPIDDPGVDVRAQKVVADQQAGPNGITVGVDVSGTAENLEFRLFSDPYMDESDILAYMVVGRSMSNTSTSDANILSSAAMALGIQQGTGLIQGLTSILPVDDVYFEGATSGSGERLSLVVGKKLTDELFIGYDHNFFDQLGEVTIRYELGRGFYVESRTSADATGADLLFSFER